MLLLLSLSGRPLLQLGGVYSQKHTAIPTVKDIWGPFPPLFFCVLLALGPFKIMPKSQLGWGVGRPGKALEHFFGTDLFLRLSLDWSQKQLKTAVRLRESEKKTFLNLHLTTKCQMWASKGKKTFLPSAVTDVWLRGSTSLIVEEASPPLFRYLEHTYISLCPN